MRFPHDGVDLLFETAKLNLPVPIGPMAQMGLSAPGTVAGILAQENAEILAGVCITQLIKPGMPVCYGGICHAFDMSTTQLIFSGPEQAIFGVAMTQMGKSYGLPVYINVGLTDAKRPDAQAGLEAGITLMLGAAAGADIYGHMGISGVDQAASLDMLILQHEIIRYVESVMREIDFSDDTFGFDETLAVGPGGTFIDRDHTAEHFRRELWFPQLLDRRYYDAWLHDGAQDTETRCRQRKTELLATHQPETVAGGPGSRAGGDRRRARSARSSPPSHVNILRQHIIQRDLRLPDLVDHAGEGLDDQYERAGEGAEGHQLLHRLRLARREIGDGATLVGLHFRQRDDD